MVEPFFVDKNKTAAHRPRPPHQLGHGQPFLKRHAVVFGRVGKDAGVARTRAENRRHGRIEGHAVLGKGFPVHRGGRGKRIGERLAQQRVVFVTHRHDGRRIGAEAERSGNGRERWLQRGVKRVGVALGVLAGIGFEHDVHLAYVVRAVAAQFLEVAQMKEYGRGHEHVGRLEYPHHGETTRLVLTVDVLVPHAQDVVELNVKRFRL